MKQNKHALSSYRQLAGLIRYEILLQYRRPGLILAGGAALLLLTLTTLGMPFFLPPPGFRLYWDELIVPAQALGMVTGNWIFVMLPLFWTDTVPVDRRSGIRELFKSLPLPDSLYLIGKLAGGLIASLLLGTAIVAYTFALAWIAFGAYPAQYYLDQMIEGALPIFVYLSSFSILLGVWQRSRIGSMLLGVAVVIGGFAMSAITNNIPQIRNLSPLSGIAFRYLMEKWGKPFGIYQRTNPVFISDIQLSLALGLVQIMILAFIAWVWLRRKESI